MYQRATPSADSLSTPPTDDGTPYDMERTPISEITPNLGIPPICRDLITTCVQYLCATSAEANVCVVYVDDDDDGEATKAQHALDRNYCH